MLTFYIVLSILVSFICSMLEAVILSVSSSYLSALKSNNKELYKKISYIEDDIERPLASILTFNTIAHTIGAAGAGAEAQKLWGNEYLSLFSAILTFAILFFSEIIPKSIGARSWKSLLPYSYLLLRPMIFLSIPIVWISSKISKFIKGEQKEKISRDEIPAMAELGLRSGTINKCEFERLKSLIRFSDLRLLDIIRPAQRVAGIPTNSSIDEALDQIQTNTYSRLLVFGVNNDDIRGYVMRKDILQAKINCDDLTIKDLSKKILILSDSTKVQVLFDRLLIMKAHIAAVINESGKFVGIITLEDLIEVLVGTKIYDEFDIE